MIELVSLARTPTQDFVFSSAAVDAPIPRLYQMLRMKSLLNSWPRKSKTLMVRHWDSLKNFHSNCVYLMVETNFFFVFVWLFDCWSFWTFPRYLDSQHNRIHKYSHTSSNLCFSMSREKTFQPGEKTSDWIPSETHANPPASLVNGIVSRSKIRKDSAYEPIFQGEAEAAIPEKGASRPAAAASNIAVPIGTRPRAEEGHYRYNALFTL